MAINLKTTVSIVDYLKGTGKESSFSARKKLFEEQGLQQRLGSFVGSGQQNTALLNLLREQSAAKTQEAAKAAEAKAPSATKRAAIEEQIKGIQSKISVLKPMLTQAQQLEKAGFKDVDVAPSEAFTKAFPNIGQTREGALRSTEQGFEEFREGKFRPIEAPGAVPGLPPPTDTGIGTKDAGVRLNDIDAAKIYDDIVTGEVTTPELELSKEETEEMKAVEDRRYAAALDQTQQALARRGMAFSGIRTKAELDLAANHFSVMSGISMGLARKVISAARQEAARREPQYMSVGGNLYRIKPGEDPEMIIEGPPDKSAPEVIGNQANGYFQYNDKTGQWDKIIEPVQDPTPVGGTAAVTAVGQRDDLIADIGLWLDQGYLDSRYGGDPARMAVAMKLFYPNFETSEIESIIRQFGGESPAPDTGVTGTFTADEGLPGIGDITIPGVGTAKGKVSEDLRSVIEGPTGEDLIDVTGGGGAGQGFGGIDLNLGRPTIPGSNLGKPSPEVAELVGGAEKSFFERLFNRIGF